MTHKTYWSYFLSAMVSTRLHHWALLFSLLLTAPLFASPSDISHFLTTYCNDCHGPEKQKGDRRFDQLTLPATKVDTLIELKDILDQINLGEMPPPKAKQPTPEELTPFLAQTNQALAIGRETLASTGGSTVLRRLNRHEYINTIGALFSLNMAAFDPTTKFPRDQSQEQMENLGDVLQTSGYLLDQYLDAADTVVEKVFALNQQPTEQTWHFTGNFNGEAKSKIKRQEYDNLHLLVRECMDSDKHVGGYAFIHEFKEGVPVDGFYEIQVLAKAMNREHPYDPKIFGTDSREPFRLGIVPGDAKIGPLELPQPQQPILAEKALADGNPEWHTMKVWLDAGQTPRFVFPNGPEDARTTWFKIAEYHKDLWPEFMDEGDKKKGKLGIGAAHRITLHVCKFPHIRIDEVKVRGPITEPWPPASQQAILGKEPFTPEKMRSQLQRFATRAYRRTATKDEVDRLIAVAEKRIATGHTPLEGFKAALKATLCSPAFIYLSQDTGNEKKKLTGNALASRLSYFLWSTMPDAELLKLAGNEELTKQDILIAQTRRMLASPRSEAFVNGFLDSWLNLRNLGGMPPDRKEFEEYYSKNFQQAFKQETRLFMRDLIERDASIVNFLDSDYSFLNQPLATHYELGELGDFTKAHEFRRVSFKTDKRGGLLGMGSVLTISANGIETSPVTRGVFLLDNILGTPPPPPPDDVPAIDPDVRGAKSIRDLLSKHRESPNCYGCHQKIDPLGFALENFDPIGDWRPRYDKAKIDSSGELPSGEKFDDVVGLKKILVQRKDLFAKMLTDRLLTYACGRRIGALDDPAVEKIVAELPKHEYGLRSLIEAVVTSELFRSR
jgi:Protein of unknown function (DUF1592)/Protein of unknown function (DUF1588)/Protein of unknown function (DUF1585)/Protein of unknown function (DUF1595)/Protein of unknown function (DUF1587)/Planctomycete cytochrome C